MQEDDVKGLPDNPLGRVTFNKTKFWDYFIDNEKLSFDDIYEKSKHGNLAEEAGSRVHSWRVMLGLLSLERKPEKWVKELRKQRARFYTISERYSIKSTK